MTAEGPATNPALPAPLGGLLRSDIQALRGFAVVLVVLHHAGFSYPTAGYLGVDIFFVVSGFVITTMVRKELAQGAFRFSSFYFRRAKRLLPAAYVVLLATALTAPFLLGTFERHDFARQLVGALTFSGNIVLWQQTGYFEGSAALKPLLHVWSLAIEEQYYLLLPALLVWVPPRWWLPALTGSTLASFALCMWAAPGHPAAAFYLLPARLWELAMGCVGALVAIAGSPWARVVSGAFWPAVALIVALPLAGPPAPAPGLETAAVCSATLVVLIRSHEWVQARSLTKGFAWVGDFSYSLYLVHWPLFAFAANAFVSPIPMSVNALLVAASFALAYLLYRGVERPVRRAEFGPTHRVLAGALFVTATLACLPLIFEMFANSSMDFARLRRVNYGLHPTCSYDARFEPTPECMTSANPRMLIWGDSFAMHWVEGLTSISGNNGVVQATKSECAPFVGLSRMSLEQPGREWALNCIAFNQSVLDYVRASQSVEVVVLSGALLGYLPDAEGNPSPNLESNAGTALDVPASADRTLAALSATVRAVRAAGKRVVFIAPPPRGSFDVGKCLERRATGQVVFGDAGVDCNISAEEYRRSQRLVINFVHRAPMEAGVGVIDPEAFLCRGSSCLTKLGDTMIYRDAGHLSYEGSRALAAGMNLTSQLDALAR